ncbi:MAG: adenylate/guanylate cyclase domain-containing protein [Desulfobacterales bacterium]
MKCPKCQFENPARAKFCNECGHSLILSSQPTPAGLFYNEQLQKIQRYLPTGLTEKILSQKDKIEGEQRQVTVMFCDMEGFAMMVEKLGSEQSYSLMDQVYEILIHKVHDLEGTVNEMTGDGIMALFGAPIALEDAPQRALSSALSIHREIDKFNDRHEKIGPIRMRIGIHTGPVVVGTLGNDLRVDFKAVGDTVNLASRMEKLAEPGSTYVSEDTFKLTDGLFEFESKGKKSIKGKEKSVAVYKLLSSNKDLYRPRLGSERRIYSEMVGREKELDRLELHVMKAINGEGSVVNIIGEAGIGKSRLLAELRKREVIERVALFEGRAISIGKNLCFHPVIDILKQWAQIRGDDGEAMAYGKLEAALKNLYPEKLGEMFPFIATLMGMKLSGSYEERIRGIEGEALENLVLKNVRELLIKASEMTPLIIIAEDLHWADISTIELMESLFRLAETHRILFINILRPGYRETGDRIVKVVNEKLPVYAVKIALEPLNEKMSEILITNVLNINVLQHEIVRKIIQRAGGNPFFIEEVARSLIDEQAVVLKDGLFQVTEKIDSIAIPNTINDVLMARIDRLEEATRNLVKIASVIGRNFFYRILADVAGTIENFEDRISYLKEIQLIRERKRMDELEYFFKHALTQETAYESILPEKRKKLHLKVARSIEKVFSDRLHEFFGMLAYHYSCAENPEKTEEYLIKAGQEALRTSASNEALHYYREALTLYLKKYGDTADPEKVAMLEKNISLALYNRGQYDEAVDYFDKALNFYWGQIPKNSIVMVIKFISGFLHLLISLYLPSLKFRKIPTPKDEEAINLYFKKLKALAIIDPKRFFLESFPFYKEVTNYDLRKFELGVGMFTGASTFFSFTGFSFKISKKILDLVRNRIEKNDIKSFTIYDFSETLHNFLEGNWKEIKEYDDNLVSRNLDLGEIYWASQHFFWHGNPKIYQGDLDTAKFFVQRLSKIYEVYENDLSLLLKYLLNTNLLMLCRKLKEALVEIDKGIEFAKKMDQAQSLIEMNSYKAQVNILMANAKGAERCLKYVDEIRRDVTTVPWQISNFYRSQFVCDLCQLEKSIESGDQSASIKYRKKAVKSSALLLKAATKVAQHRTEAYKLKGLYYWIINKQGTALGWWHKAIEAGESLGARLELSRTYYEIGKRLLEPQSKHKELKGITAQEYLEKARVLFNEMDLQWDLDELNQVLNA